MAEYIDRNAAIDAVTDVYYDTPEINLTAEKFEAAINAIPSADVVHVVRCEDCEYSFYWENNLACGSEDAMCDFVRKDFYCAYGKKKEGGESG